MSQIKKTPIDILDDIYSLAYWMTGSEDESTELVQETYIYADNGRKETDLLRIFRERYVERYGQKIDFCISEKSCKSFLPVLDSLKLWAADIKLSVLLSEISGLKHVQIAAIVEKPVDTVREWLLHGRKILVDDCLLKASA